MKFMRLKISIYKSIFIGLSTFLIAFIVGLSAFAMSPSSTDLALALDQKNNSSQQIISNKLDASDQSKQGNDLQNDNSSTINKNQGSVSFDTNLSNPQSYSEVNDDSGLVMQITPQILKQREMINKKQEQTSVASDSLEENDFPDSIDLRNVNGKNYVSNVKNQYPWATCWAFGSIAASEINLQSTFNKTFDQSPIDISEKHSAWFVKNHIPAYGEEGYNAYNTQSGEGFWHTDDISEENYFWFGGFSNYISQAFSCGIGPAMETNFPYRGVLGRVSSKINGKITHFDSYDEAIKAGYDPLYYSAKDDWSVSEDFRNSSEYKLKDSPLLPNAKPIKNDKGEYILNEVGVNAIKGALYDKNGVAVAFMTESSEKHDDPSQATERYTNTDNWASYVWDDSSIDRANHIVCIVGYDDNYSKENFTVQNPAKWDLYNNVLYKLNGMNLENDASGNPYYEKEVDGKTVQVVLDKNSVLIEPQEGSKTLYKLKNTELENNTSGKPYYPDETHATLMPDVDILCEPVRDESGSHTPQGDGAWICKNSWGSSSQSFPNHSEWGLDGYFYLSYYDLSIIDPQVFEFDDEKDADNQNILRYQYDFMPTPYYYSSKFDNSNFSEYRSGNVFTASEDTLLDSVSTQTADNNTKCEICIYLLNEKYSGPEDGELLESQVITFSFAGFHSIDLNNEIIIPKGKKFSVIVKQELLGENNSNSSNQVMILPTNFNQEFMTDYGYSGEYSKSVVNEGESYVVYTNKYTNTECVYDWNEFIKTQDYYNMSSNFFSDSRPRKYFDIDNVPVKAFGKTVTNSSPEDSNIIEDIVGSPASTGDLSLTFILAFLIVNFVLFVFFQTKRLGSKHAIR